MCTKNLSEKELRKQYKKLGLLKHYLNIYKYQNDKAMEEEFKVKFYSVSQKQTQTVKMAEFILAYENIKRRNQ